MKRFNHFQSTLAFYSAVLLTLGSIRYFDHLEIVNIAVELGVFALLLMIQTYVIQLVQRYFHPESLLNVNNIITVALFASISASILQLAFLNADFNSDASLLHFFTNFLIGFFLLFFSMLVHWTDARQQEFDRLKNRAVEKERESINFQLKSIEKQWQPHFLFNSLNSISALTIVDPKKARHMIQLLSDFMRHSVLSQREELISLEEELKYVQLYNEIEQIRFGDRLHVRLSIPDESLPTLVPRMILQPLVENAIKYGLYDSTDKVEISIICEELENATQITIGNPYDIETSYRKTGTGFGLDSVKKRLFLIYHRNDLLTIEKSEEIFKVSIKFIK